MNLTDLFKVKIKNVTNDKNYFYDYEISYIDNVKAKDYDANYENFMIILPPNINNSNSTNNYDAKNLPISLFYIFLILTIYFVLLFLIFICALYTHRRRIGYNYEGLREESSENEIEFDDGVKLFENEDDICGHEEEIVNESEGNFRIVDKQPVKNINSISNEIDFINQVSDDNILLNFDILSENVQINYEDRNRLKKRKLFKNRFHKKLDKTRIYKKNFDFEESSKLEPLLKNNVDDDVNRLLFAEDDV